MKTVPIVVNFNRDQVLGEARLNLPPDVELALANDMARLEVGGLAKKMHLESGKRVIDDFELLEISVVMVPVEKEEPR